MDGLLPLSSFGLPYTISLDRVSTNIFRFLLKLNKDNPFSVSRISSGLKGSVLVALSTIFMLEESVLVSLVILEQIKSFSNFLESAVRSLSTLSLSLLISKSLCNCMICGCIGGFGIESVRGPRLWVVFTGVICVL